MLGDLRQYLPAGSQFNRCELTMATDATAQLVVTQLQLPEQKAFLLMVNGDMIQPDEYAATCLRSDDEVTLFPPIKGG